jgi:hypothetical protein
MPLQNKTAIIITMEYDGDWKISWDKVSQVPSDPLSWPLLTNGNVGIVPSLDTSNRYGLCSVKNVVSGMSTSSQYDSFAPMNTFDISRVKCTLVDETETASYIEQTTLTDLQLNMQYGVLSATFSTSVSGLEIKHEWRALKHVQHAILHTLCFTGSVPPDTSKIVCYHEVGVPEGWSSADMVHNSDTVNGIGYNDGSDGVLYVSSSSYVNQQCASAFIRVGNDTSRAHPISSYVNERNASTSVIPIAIADPLGAIDVTLAVLSVVQVMPCRPKKTVMAHFGNTREMTPVAALASVISANDAAWNTLWKSQVVVNGSASILHDLNWAIRYSQWMLHSSYSTTLDESSPGIGDVSPDGPIANGRQDSYYTSCALLHVFLSGEQQLNARCGQLPSARQTTRSDGYQGSGFPYNELKGSDVSEAKLALLGSEPPVVRGSAFLAINCWNHYRIRRDLRWLHDFGYAMIRDTCDYIASLAYQPDPVGQPQLYSLPSEQAGTLDLISSIAALRCGIEASYALRYDPKEAWVAIRYGLRVPVDGLDSNIVLAPANTNLNPVDTQEPSRALQEPLFSLASDFGLVSVGMITATFEQWMPPLGTPCKTYVAEMVRLHGLGQIMQIHQNQISKSQFSFQLRKVLDTHFDLVTGFGNARAPGGHSAHNNDMAAQFVLAVMQGLCGVKVTGGLTETGEEYATFGVNSSVFSSLPSGWDGIAIRGLGYSQADMVIMNGASDYVKSASDSPWRENFII